MFPSDNRCQRGEFRRPHDLVAAVKTFDRRNLTVAPFTVFASMLQRICRLAPWTT
jgi:hypothetical protein